MLSSIHTKWGFLLISVSLAFWRNRAADRLLLFVLIGALSLIALTLAHINDYYFIFLMPFICLFFGAGFVDSACAAGQQLKNETLSLGIWGIFIVLCALQLFTAQAYERFAKAGHSHPVGGTARNGGHWSRHR